MSRLQRFALAAGIGSYLLVVLGGIVRASGSGLGCPDWPLCHGGVVPPLEYTALLEYSHRFVAALVSILIVAVAVEAWLFRRRERALAVGATLVPLLLLGEILLGAITVWLELPPFIVLVHLALAMLILGVLVWLTVAAGPPPLVLDRSVSVTSSLNGLVKLAGITALALFFLLMTGAYVLASGASLACSGFPDCNGALFPFGTNRLIDIHLLHRFTAYGVTILLVLTLVRAWHLRRQAPALGKAVLAVAISAIFQLAVGVLAVSNGVPAFLQALHVAGATATWATVVLLLSLVLHSRGQRVASVAGADPSPQQTASERGFVNLASSYIKLTKPAIISLLLVTTLGSMMIAAQGLPPLPLIAATLLGGALAAGAANTFNCYLDRDIDQVMGRTSLRPLPAGVIRPLHALLFGFGLTVLSILILGLLVNWLAASLAMAGLLYYIFVYTCWLKRSSPSNIVIGGAAGVVPPLVGWAAVTGEVSLLAVYFFAIIFFWTPPHFWALALLIRREYERARIPMLPIVRGDEETRHQILLYSLFLVAFTLLVVVFRQMGLFYLVAALALGGTFVYHAARLLQEANARAARRLFRYSILYLALLFAAMVIDRWKVS